MFAFKDFFESTHRFRDGDVLPFMTGEDFRYVKRLAKETLDFSGAINGELVLRA